jgi:histidyl-tRNA synthetase
MKMANAARASIVAFAGGEESARNQIRFKDMNTGDERTIARDVFIDELTARLPATGAVASS